MKKLVRLISVVMLIAMLFSLMNVCAFADVVFDEEGTDVSGASGSGNLVISSDPNADINGKSENNVYYTESAETETAEKIPAASGSTYSIMTTSANALEYFQSEEMLESNPMVYYNAKYIVYIREHLDELKASDPDVVETAYALFGSEIIDKEFSKATTTVTKEVALKAQAESLNKVIAALAAVSDDAESILAVRKAANEYTESFAGVANYDYTSDESGFTSAASALEGAKNELAAINAEIAKLAEGDVKVTPTPTPTTEPKEEAEATPAPEITPTPNEAIVAEEAQEADNAEEANESSVLENALDAAEPDAKILYNPLKMFLNAFAVPMTSYATVNALSGTTSNVSTMEITGLANFELIICLNNAVLNCSSGPAFVIKDPNTFVTFEAMTINGEGFEVNAGNVVLKYVTVNNTTGYAVNVTGGKFEMGNSTINTSGDGYAINVSGGTCNINGYNKISSSSINNAVRVAGGTVTIDGTDVAESLISNVGTNCAGLEIAGGYVNAEGQAKISGFYGVKFTGSGSFTMKDSVVIEGTGKNGAAIYAADYGTAYISGGTLRSEYGYAIYTNENKGNVYVANDEEVIQTSYYDCQDQYDSGIISVNNKSFADLASANSEIAVLISADKQVTVKLQGDITDTTGVGLKVDGGNVSIIGNGHAIKSSGNALNVLGGANVVVSNISLEAGASYAAIYVEDGDVNVADNVIAKSGLYGIYAVDGYVSVNGLTTYTTNAFKATAPAEIVVNSCKNNSPYPVGQGNSTDCLKILGGYFLFTKGDDSDTTTWVETFVPEGVAYMSSKVDSDGYYVVSMEYTPTVLISSNVTTGTESDGTPYVVYDKANPKYITFTVDPKVLRIDAVPIEGGSTINVFNNTAKGGTEGDITIDIDAFQNNLKAGVYDLQFQFKNGYYMIDKVHLYVLPETCRLVNSDLNTSTDKEYQVTEYRVGSKTYFYAWVSELPTKIGVSSDPNGSVISWFDYYDGTSGEEGIDQKYIRTSKDAKGYFILVDYAYLDQLSSGQSYIFLDYSGAIKRLELKIVNDNVKISPTSMDFWGTDSSAVFTVTPDFKDVYIDGELVPTEFVKYNTDTHKLTISGEYLEHIKSGEHLMEVETSYGWVSATIRTGVGLAPDGVDYHVYGGAKALAFKASDKIDTTAGIYIGKNSPVKIDPTLIYFYDNDTKFTVSPSYLNRLSLGTYYISAYVWNPSIEDYEYTSTTFRIVSASSAAYNPGTGDDNYQIVWIVIAVLAAVIAAVFLIPALKKNKAAELKVTEEKVENEETDKEKTNKDKEKE